MSELSETFSEWREFKKNKKAMNKELSTKLLSDMDVKYESKNHGNHLIVHAPEGLIDFWPSTGLWTDRNNRIQRRGVFRMLKFMGINI